MKNFQRQKSERFPYIGYFDKPKFTLTETVRYPVGATDGVISLNSEPLILDMGEETVGRVRFSLRGHGTLRIYYGENIEELDYYFDPKAKDIGWYRPPIDTVSVDSDAPIRAESRGRRAFRFMKLIADGEIALTLPYVAETHYPVGRVAFLNSSDEVLNKIWQISERTTRLCMQQYYEDGIKRDGLLWIGDCRIQAISNYALFGDCDLIKKCLKYFAETMDSQGRISCCGCISGAHQHPENINYMWSDQYDRGDDYEPSFIATLGESLFYLSYMADFTSAVGEYYEYSHDDAFLAEIWGFVVRNMDYVCSRIWREDDPESPFFPRAKCMDGRPWDIFSDGASVSGSIVSAIDRYIHLAEVVGDSENLGKAREYRDTLLTYIKNELVSPDGTMYYRSPVYGDVYISQVAQALAILGGYGDRDAIRDFYLYHTCDDGVAKVKEGMDRTYNLMGMFECGLHDEAVDNIRSGWGYMVERGATTAWENFEEDYTPGSERKYATSRCHGWSGSPPHFFNRYILGVRPLTDGWTCVRVSPNISGLEFAEGTVPTVHGDIYVRADSHGVTVRAPENIEIVIDENEDRSICILRS